MKVFWCPTHAEDGADLPAHVVDAGPAKQAEPATNAARLRACRHHTPAWRDVPPAPGEPCTCATCGGEFTYGHRAEAYELRPQATDAGSRWPEDEQAAQAAGYLGRGG